MDVNNLFFGSISYWFWVGTIYLIIMTYQDYRRDKKTGLPRMLVDDRLNFFMMGSTFALLSHVRRPLWYMLVMVVFVVVLGFVLRRYKFLGFADVQSIGWIVYGFGIINLDWLLTYLSLFIITTSIYAVLKFGIFKYDKPTPFYGIILLSFVLTSLYYGAYLL